MQWDFDMRMKEEWNGNMDRHLYEFVAENRLVDHFEVVRVWMGAFDYLQWYVVLPNVDFAVLWSSYMDWGWLSLHD